MYVSYVQAGWVNVGTHFCVPLTFSFVQARGGVTRYNIDNSVED